MTVTVWKFVVPPEGEFSLKMPAGAKLLDVQEQHGIAAIWAQLDPDADMEVRRFRQFGTGHEFDPEGLSYVGSYQLMAGTFVAHLYEVG